MTTPTARRRAGLVTPTFLLITAAAFAYFTALGMVLPTLPQFVEDELGGSGTAVGVAAGAMAVTAALLRPWVGRTGDDAGRRKLVTLGAVLVALSFVGHALSTTLWQLVLARLLTGAGEAMFFVGASTAIQDLAPDDRRGEAASYFSLALWGGLGLGPVVAQWMLRDDDFGAVWLTAAALGVVAALFGRATPPGPPALDDGRRRRFFQRTAVQPGTVLMLSVIGLSSFQTFLVLYAEDVGTDAAPLFALYAVLVVGVRLFGARLADVHGPRRIAMTALVLEGCALLLIAGWATTPGLALGTAALAIGVAPIYPALLALTIDASPPEERSSAMATFSLFFDLSQGLGLPLLGTIVAAGGERSAFLTGAALCVLAFALSRAWLPNADHRIDTSGLIPEG